MNMESVFPHDSLNRTEQHEPSDQELKTESEEDIVPCSGINTDFMIPSSQERNEDASEKPIKRSPHPSPRVYSKRLQP
jgi:hypothetical protein